MKTNIAVQSNDYWRRSWQHKRSAFILHQTQESNPEKWARFYDFIGRHEPETWNSMHDHGSSVTNLLFQKHIIQPGSSVLDVGCGVGTLSVPLARRGTHVTALDGSYGMLSALAAKAEAHHLSNIRIVQESFQSFRPTPLYDLVIAAFFPPAFCPEGLEKLESMSGRYVAVLLGSGKEVFPFRKALWERLINAVPPSGTFHLAHVLGFLQASGRRPALSPLSQSIRAHRSPSSLIRFYKHYFDIFGVDEKRSESIITRYFESFAIDGAVKLQGEVHMNLVWWKTSGTNIEP